MKSLALEAASVLEQNAIEFSAITEFDVSSDIAINRYVASLIRTCRIYMLPAFGYVDRARMREERNLDFSRLVMPAESFAIEFRTNEAALHRHGAKSHVTASYLRFALVQDLRVEKIFKTWDKLLGSQPECRQALNPNSFLVLPLTRAVDPDRPTGPGNRGWMMGWLGVTVPFDQKPGRIVHMDDDIGGMQGASLEYKRFPVGTIGVQTAAALLADGNNLEEEEAREVALELFATIDLIRAVGLKCDRSRRDIHLGRNVWRAGSGSVVPKPAPGSHPDY